MEAQRNAFRESTSPELNLEEVTPEEEGRIVLQAAKLPADTTSLRVPDTFEVPQGMRGPTYCYLISKAWEVHWLSYISSGGFETRPTAESLVFCDDESDEVEEMILATTPITKETWKTLKLFYNAPFERMIPIFSVPLDAKKSPDGRSFYIEYQSLGLKICSCEYLDDDLVFTQFVPAVPDSRYLVQDNGFVNRDNAGRFHRLNEVTVGSLDTLQALYEFIRRTTSRESLPSPVLVKCSFSNPFSSREIMAPLDLNIAHIFGSGDVLLIMDASDQEKAQAVTFHSEVSVVTVPESPPTVYNPTMSPGRYNEAKYNYPHSSQYVPDSSLAVEHLVDREKNNLYEPGKGVCLGGTGLKNLGNTCYMNSALQCFRNIPALVDYFLSHSFREHVNELNPLGHKGVIAEAFYEIMSVLWSKNIYSCVAPYHFKKVMGAANIQFNDYSQQDSHEFISFLMDALHEDLNRVIQKPFTETVEGTDFQDLHEAAEEAWKRHSLRNQSYIVDHFQGLFKSTVVCTVCNHRSITFDPFTSLSLPIPVFVQAQPSTPPVIETPKQNVFMSYLPRLTDVEGEFSRVLSASVSITPQTTFLDLKTIFSSILGLSADELFIVERFSERYHIKHDATLVSRLYSVDEYFLVHKEEPLPLLCTACHSNAPLANHNLYNIYLDACSACLCAKCISTLGVCPECETKIGSIAEWNSLSGPNSSDTLIVIEPKIKSLSTYRSLPLFVSIRTDPALGTLKVRHFQEAISERLELYLSKMKHILEGRSIATFSSSSALPSTLVASVSRDPFKPLSSSSLPSTFISLANSSHLEGPDEEPRDAGFFPLPRPTPLKKAMKTYSRRHFAPNLPPSSAPPRRFNDRGDYSDLEEDTDEEGAEAQALDSPLSSEPLLSPLKESPNEVIVTIEDSPSDNKENEVSSPLKRKREHELSHVAHGGEKMAAGTIQTSLQSFTLRLSTALLAFPSFAAAQDEEFNFKANHNQDLPCVSMLFSGDTSPSLAGVVLKSTPVGATDPSSLSLSSYTQPRTPSPPPADLHECLSAFSKVEVLTDANPWYCGRCKAHQAAEKKMEIWRLPDCLIIQLKRFYWKDHIREKITRQVNYPLEGLDLTEFVVGGCGENASSSETKAPPPFSLTIDPTSSFMHDENEFPSVIPSEEILDILDGDVRFPVIPHQGPVISLPNKKNVYDLSSVIIHRGELSYGHYVAIAKNDIEDKWIEYNDERCALFPDSSVQDPNTYCLFYQRRSGHASSALDTLLSLETFIPPNSVEVAEPGSHPVDRVPHPSPLITEAANGDAEPKEDLDNLSMETSRTASLILQASHNILGESADPPLETQQNLFDDQN